MKIGNRAWHWYIICEAEWRRWEFGFGLYFDDWIPREWSAALMVGPLLLMGGIEENYPQEESLKKYEDGLPEAQDV
jgi:hypothetical protein